MNITNYLEENYPDYMDKILLADGFEEAFMGVVESFGNEPKACYNYDACIDILMAESWEDEPKAHRLREVEVRGMTYDEAVEYLEFNVTQAYVGENTPAFIMNVALEGQKL